MSLILDGLWKSFAHSGSDQHVLRGVDLAVEPGTFTSLTGHSGCGKSTLINLLGGLSRPDAGTITLDGRPVTGPGPDRAMVFQDYSLLPRLSLVDNVRVAVRSSRPERGRDHADAAAERYLRARLQAQLVELWRSDSETEIVVMVTHGIDEAALLSDRIVVMGTAPSPSVVEVLEVDIARPRDRVRDAVRLEEVQARLHGLLAGEALEGVA